MKITFAPLTKDNWKTCVSLWTTEDRHVTSNLYSIAEAQFHPRAISRAIHADDEMIGYTMYGQDDEDDAAWAIDRFMIANAYRRKGLGFTAFNQIVELGRSEGYRRFITSTDIENLPMQNLLQKAGFQTNHEIKEGEYLYFLSLGQS